MRRRRLLRHGVSRARPAAGPLTLVRCGHEPRRETLRDAERRACICARVGRRAANIERSGPNRGARKLAHIHERRLSGTIVNFACELCRDAAQVLGGKLV
jgi:hypothetical protein